jgi:hypothetical protein
MAAALPFERGAGPPSHARRSPLRLRPSAAPGRAHGGSTQDAGVAGCADGCLPLPHRPRSGPANSDKMCRAASALSLSLGPVPHLSNLSLSLSTPPACLKDLQRFLRRDDPATRPAFTHLARFNLAKSDLVPLLMRCAEDEEVVTHAREFCISFFSPWNPHPPALPFPPSFFHALPPPLFSSPSISTTQ